MNNLTTVLAKLDKVNFTSLGDNRSFNGELMGKKVVARVSIEMETMSADRINEMPIQAVISITFDGSVVAGWGCENTKDNAELVTWYVKNEARIMKNEFKTDRDNKKVSEVIWASI
jgi:hypothetical protein